MLTLQATLVPNLLSAQVRPLVLLTVMLNLICYMINGGDGSLE